MLIKDILFLNSFCLCLRSLLKINNLHLADILNIQIVLVSRNIGHVCRHIFLLVIRALIILADLGIFLYFCNINILFLFLLIVFLYLVYNYNFYNIGNIVNLVYLFISIYFRAFVSFSIMSST